MFHMGCNEFAHARWKSRWLLVVVSLSFGIGETNCLQSNKRGTFSAKMVYKRVRGWTLGWSLPVLSFVKYDPPPPSPVFPLRKV